MAQRSSITCERQYGMERGDSSLKHVGLVSVPRALMIC